MPALPALTLCLPCTPSWFPPDSRTLTCCTVSSGAAAQAEAQLLPGCVSQSPEVTENQASEASLGLSVSWCCVEED